MTETIEMKLELGDASETPRCLGVVLTALVTLCMALALYVWWRLLS